MVQEVSAVRAVDKTAPVREIDTSESDHLLAAVQLTVISSALLHDRWSVIHLTLFVLHGRNLLFSYDVPIDMTFLEQ